LEVRDALAAAAARGVKVQVLVDAIGSQFLSDRFWAPVRSAGGIVRWFHPFSPRRLPIRDHRKIFVSDDRLAIIGGFNIAPEYLGDGIAGGWRDIAVAVQGNAVAALRSNFEEMFERSLVRSRIWQRFGSRTEERPWFADGAIRVLPVGPGRGQSCFQRALNADLAHGREADIASAYFLPGVRLRRRFRQISRRGGRVRIVVPARSDVPLAQNAARFLYTGLLRGGAEIYEYLPQMLHSKLYRVDRAVYAGSSNLDARSLHINYEIMVRLGDPALVAEARGYFEDLINRSRRITLDEWRRSRSAWEAIREWCAFFILARLDPYLTRWLTRAPR
jgi:cardiolipin synthase